MNFTAKNFRHLSFWKLLFHLPKLIRLIIRLIKDRRIPLLGKIAFAISLLYFVWPFDLVSEIIFPFIGLVDDLAVLLAGLRFLLHQTPTDILEEHLAEISLSSAR